jgi:hypothetical protein
MLKFKGEEGNKLLSHWDNLNKHNTALTNRETNCSKKKLAEDAYNRIYLSSRVSDIFS